MGSLTSRPKVPQTVQPQIIYTQTPLSPSTSAPSFPEAAIPEGAEDQQGTNADTEIRITNLLRRNRGLPGTIRTGFRGLLSANNLVPQRKTLLGE